MNAPITPHDALIFTMVMASAVDSQMNEKELKRIGQLLDVLPVFEGFDKDDLIPASQRCADLLAGPEGLDITLEIIRDALPPSHYDTAYALAVEITAVDLNVRPEEIRLLQLLRDRLQLDKLTCAAIERSAIARYRRV
ncbi:tellurite resistance TerB family protein [Rhizobium sp. RU36D]|uniref:tellurite resistance TerB family protein n=1 Tax=Rhizobium sp. RU36D TaxID=1907415 RepID=UPI0009FD1832|nr:tellurite resistance TerB family protein [Rhizobium sp. RU36D]